MLKGVCGEEEHKLNLCMRTNLFINVVSVRLVPAFTLHAYPYTYICVVHFQTYICILLAAVAGYSVT